MKRESALLAARIRTALANEPSTREVPMFGGVSFMVNEKMVVATHKHGDLLVRVDPERSSELLACPGARRAEMGTGRAMGPGWLAVAGNSLADKDLSFWIGVALDYNGRAGRR